MEAVLVLLIPAIASVIANFTEVKPEDGPKTKVAKKLINLFALNWSAKAGK